MIIFDDVFIVLEAILTYSNVLRVSYRKIIDSLLSILSLADILTITFWIFIDLINDSKINSGLNNGKRQ
jgi:hypothetical protein